MGNFGNINSVFAPQYGMPRPTAPVNNKNVQGGYFGQPILAGRGYAPPVNPMSQDFIRGFMAGAQAFARTARNVEQPPYRFGSDKDYGRDYGRDYGKDYDKPNSMVEQFVDLVKSLLGIDQKEPARNTQKPGNPPLRPDPSYWPDRKGKPDLGILPIVGNDDPKAMEELFLLVLMMQQTTTGNTGRPEYN